MRNRTVYISLFVLVLLLLYYTEEREAHTRKKAKISPFRRRTEQASCKADIDRLKRRTDDIERRTDRLERGKDDKGQPGDIKRRTDELERETGELRQLVDKNGLKLWDLRKDLRSVTGRVETLEQQQEKLHGEVKMNSMKIQDVESALQNITTRLDTRCKVSAMTGELENDELAENETITLTETLDTCDIFNGTSLNIKESGIYCCWLSAGFRFPFPFDIGLVNDKTDTVVVRVMADVPLDDPTIEFLLDNSVAVCTEFKEGHTFTLKALGTDFTEDPPRVENVRLTCQLCL